MSPLPSPAGVAQTPDLAADRVNGAAASLSVDALHPQKYVSRGPSSEGFSCGSRRWSFCSRRAGAAAGGVGPQGDLAARRLSITNKG